MPRRRSPRTVVMLIAASLVVGSLAGGVAGADTTVIEGSVASFDNARIYYTLFEPPGPFEMDADGDIPVVFMTHGWSGSRVRDPNNTTVDMLVDAGYAVVTWDSRGFGRSGGEANVDSQEFEVRDLQVLIDSIVVRDEIATDDLDFDETVTIEKPCNDPPTQSPPVAIPSQVQDVLDEIFPPSPSPSFEPCPEEPEYIEVVVHHSGMDPKMGMLGGSYAGGIQLMVAAADPRVDAIVPEITWNDLPNSIKPNGVLRLGWDLLLYAAGVATGTTGGLTTDPYPQVETSPAANGGPVPDVVVKDPPNAGSVSPHIHQALAEGVALNDWSAATYDWFGSRSTARYIDGGTLVDDTEVPGVSAATMLVQGTSDTLFNLTEAVHNFETIGARTDDRYNDDPSNPRSNGGKVPAKLVAFCGGHTWATVGVPFPTSCVAGADQGAYIDGLKMRWLNRWVKGDDSVDTGPAVEHQLQGGQFRQRTHLPLSTLSVKGETRLKNTVVPQSGAILAPTVAGCHPKASKADAATPAASCPVEAENDWFPIGTLTGPPLPRAQDPGRFPTLEFPRAGTVMLGSGRMKATVLGLAPEVYFFVKFIEWDPVKKTATIIDDQVTAVKVPWPSLDAQRVVSFDLAGVSWEVKEAQVVGNRVLPYEYYMEITTTSNDHASSRFPSQTTVFVEGTIPAISPPFLKSPPSNVYPWTQLSGSLRSASKQTGSTTLKGFAEPGGVVTVSDNGSTLGTATTPSGGEWSLTQTLAEGQHIVNITTPADLNGTILSSGDRCFVVDDLGVAPSDPTNVTVSVAASKEVTFKGDGLKGSYIDVKEGDTYLTPAPTPNTPGGVLVTPYCTTAGNTKDWTAKKTMTSGVHTVQIRSRDLAGNVSSVVEQTFTVP